MIRAMANNVKLQVAKVLEEQVQLKMKNEYVRLQVEEAARVKDYTAKWQVHVDKIQMDKEAEKIARLEEQRLMFEAKLAEEEVKVKEAQSMARKASVAAAMTAASASVAK